MSNSKIVVSISCVTYNHAPYIRQCLDGFLKQQCDFGFEVLIHDDASTDGTADIIRAYQAKYPEIIKPILREKNLYSQGERCLNARFNFARAKGKYVAMCEGDDFWVSSNKLQKQIDFLEANAEFAGAYHDTEVIYTDYNKKPHLFRKNMPDLVSAEDTVSFLAPFHTSSFIFRLAAFELPSWLFKVESADMGMFSIIASKGNLKNIPNVLSVYRKHIGGITNTAAHTTQYNEKRIELLNYLNSYHNYSFNKKAKYVIAQHKLNSTINPLVRLLIKARIKFYQKFK